MVKNNGKNNYLISLFLPGFLNLPTGLDDRLNSLALTASDPEFAALVKDGWDWEVVPWYVERLWPEFVDLPQGALNAEHTHRSPWHPNWRRQVQSLPMSTNTRKIGRPRSIEPNLACRPVRRTSTLWRMLCATMEAAQASQSSSTQHRCYT